VRCALAALLACVLSAWSWAQAGPSPILISPPAAPTMPAASQPISILGIAQNSLADSQTLVSRLTERKAQALKQIEAWQTIVAALKQEIENDKQNSIDLSAKLAKAEAALATSQAALTETSSSLDASKAAFAALSLDFSAYKAAAEAEIRAHSLALGLWRAGALAAVSCVAGTLLEGRLGQGSAWGAAAGAGGGAVWYFAEHWPLGKVRL
jgi:hypothetical protein